MKNCTSKADFTVPLNQATLFGGDRSLLIPTRLPVISNKLAKNGPKSFFSLFVPE